MSEHRPIDENLVLGIDVGIGSCGWALLRLGEHPRILRCGSRCFDLPEHPKTKQLKNATRRMERLARRRLRRRSGRMARLRRLLHAHGLLPSADPEDIKRRNLDPWKVRADALDRRADGPELAVALLHIAKHRGFKSTRKDDRGNAAPPDGKKMLKAMETMRAKSGGYATVGQMLFADEAFRAKKRNVEGDYSHTLPRDLLEAEVRILFERQRRLGNPLATAELEEAFRDIAFRQCPAGDSEDMVGPCPFEPGEKRAARQSYSFELFRYLARLVNLRVKTGEGPAQPLAPDEIRAAVRDFGRQRTITYRTLRKAIDLSPHATFEGVAADKEEKDIVASAGAADGTSALRSALGEAAWRTLLAAPKVLDDIAFVLAFRDDIASIRAGLEALGLEPLILRAVMTGVEDGRFGHFKRAGHISAKAARNLVPHLLAGGRYDEACAHTGYDHAATRRVLLDDIRNPVTVRALREALKQVDTLIHEGGARPGRIHVELAREVGKGPEERDALARGIERRTAERERNRAQYMADTGRESCSDEDLLRYELWREQHGRCIYSDAYIPVTDIAAGLNRVQVDHILPLSRTQDNSFTNLVLCTAGANQDKKNKTPYEWRGTDETWWRAFDARVEALRAKGLKKRNLLLRDLASREGKFVTRNINDTRYVARALLAELRSRYPEDDGERRIFARPGPLTNILRRAWGLDHLKRGADGGRIADDRHHALDAIIVACISESTLNRLTRLYQEQELAGRNRWAPPVEPPWDGFRDDVIRALDGVLVSRAETRRGRGKGHDATIRQVREEDGVRIVYERKPIEKLTGKDLANVKDAERNAAVIASLSAWIDRGKPKDDPPRSPKGDAIRKVRVRMGEKAGITVRGGHADNGDMVRTDVFWKDGKYYLVPIYVHQVANRSAYPAPPNRAIVAYKPEDEWTPIDGSYEFRFSLYPNSYVQAVKPNGEVIEGYYRGTDRSTGAVRISPHYTQDEVRAGVGVKTLRSFTKHAVDRLGRKYEIERERRTWHGAVCT